MICRKLEKEMRKFSCADKGTRRISVSTLPNRLLLALTVLLLGANAHSQSEALSDDVSEVGSQQSPIYVTGKQLMTEEERATMRERMHSAASDEERARLRAENHAKMAVRAQERGLVLGHPPNQQSSGKHKRQGGKGPHGGPHHQNKGKRKAAVSEADISAAQIWGKAENVVQVKHLYFSAQPDAAGINAAKDAGVEVVINLRGSEEMDWDEAAAVEEAGLTYYQVPISGDGPGFDQSSMQRISALVKKHHQQPLWLHCSSGNRASAWLAVHLVQDHHMDIDQSVALAQKVGLTSAELEKRIRTYVAPSPSD
jgi:uncharacterized protein (TIGR01244 family)